MLLLPSFAVRMVAMNNQYAGDFVALKGALHQRDTSRASVVDGGVGACRNGVHG